MGTATSDRRTGTHRPAGWRRALPVWWNRRITWGKAVWRRLSARPGVAHLVRAGERFGDRMGNQFAAAITYFSFLSLVPILMVAFSAAGFFLSFRPDLVGELKVQVTAFVPGKLADSVGGIIDQAVQQRLTVGIIGLLVAAYSGLSWMGNVRDAVQAQWRPQWERATEARQNYWMDRLSDLISLLGLAVAVLVSFTLTAIGSSAQDLVVGWLGLEQFAWLRPALTVGPIVVAILADVLIFAWIYTILPYKAYRAHGRTLLIGSLAMAVCFEVLKAGLTLLVSRISTSPSGAVFGSVIGLLFFFNLVARIFLFVAAWLATGTPQGASTSRTAGRPVGEAESGGRPSGAGGDGTNGVRDLADGGPGGDGAVPRAPVPVVVRAEPDRRRTATVFGLGVLSGALWQRWRRRR
ncbi:MAG TPA: inner membrane protein YhjD [Nakamurella sp.]|nr:inner membrane protein YhjD [Nakamurella sp.]